MTGTLGIVCYDKYWRAYADTEEKGIVNSFSTPTNTNSPSPRHLRRLGDDMRLLRYCLNVLIEGEK